MSHAHSWIAHAMLYTERFGLSVIPMDGKKPSVLWKEYQSRYPTVAEILSWPKEDLAILTGAISNICVVDCESREDAMWFWENKGKSPVIVQTKRGFHFYFRHPGQKVSNGIKIFDRYDVRGDGGYVLAPPSRHSDGAYRWVKPMIAPDALPVFDMDWRPETVYQDYASDKRILDGAAYIAKIFAVAGEGGHGETWRACQRLRDSGMDQAEALLCLMSWNKTNCDPPWSERDLLHKVRDVYK